MPPPEEPPRRVDSALEVPYLMFNEGYSALAGDELVRADLCHEAIRLVALLAAHPGVGTPRVHALAALLLFQASRLPAQSGPDRELLLLERQPSPVVALNRAVALAHLGGPEIALGEIDRLRHARVLRHYHPLHACRGELLRRLGRHGEAADAFQEALALTSSEPVRRFLARRIGEAQRDGSAPPGLSSRG